MKFTFLTGLLVSITFFSFGQDVNKVINVKDVERIERKLASDEMRGRRINTPEIDKAADFIASEFKSIGLKKMPGLSSFRQEFVIARSKPLSTSVIFNGEALDEKKIFINSSATDIEINEKSDFDLLKIGRDENFGRVSNAIAPKKKFTIVLVDTAHRNNISRMAQFRRGVFKTPNTIIYIVADQLPSSFSIKAKQEVTEQKMANVVGVLPGKSKKHEYVIFSAHYDHIGVGKPVDGDSIYNGANDDAAGVTAVISLAKYYKARKSNERTILFVAFTAEESGGYGAQYFSRQLDPAAVAAMFNIEMIGTPSKWGKNSAFITGFDKTNMGEIMQKNLQSSGFNFYPDPYPEQNLFYRSDNATLARLGVPAHTVSTAKMDSEPHYHKVSDHVETLDLENMTAIIRSIAISAESIIKGKDTPTRVKTEELR